MKVAISEKFDDMRIGPEAYRLYMHFLCEQARLNSTDAVLELNRTVRDVLNKCRIDCDCSEASEMQHFRELENRNVIRLDLQTQLDQSNFLPAFETYIKTVTFLPEGEWV